MGLHSSKKAEMSNGETKTQLHLWGSWIQMCGMGTEPPSPTTEVTIWAALHGKIFEKIILRLFCSEVKY